ncbi:MAG: uroporphyrinogen decarboxylase [Acidobacteria bacterium]|nr:uroporphyrinogen decarboxylase [Acidobacteriota bacterium]
MTIHDSRFLKACRKESADCTPVWFMRQAGRYMKAYRAIREKYGLMEMFKTPGLAAEITLQPVGAFAVDAAIIFSDILLPLEGMGVGIDFPRSGGVAVRNPVRNDADVEALRIADPEGDLGFVLESLRLVRPELEGKVPLIGFAGAPYTLASYAIEGASSPHQLGTKDFMVRNPDGWDRLMKKLSETVVALLKAQVRAGAQAVQVFDSWIGGLGPADYREYVLPHMRKIFQSLKEETIPSIHFGTGTAGLLPLLAEAGGDVIGVDWRISLDRAWMSVETGAGLQGNLDPVALTAPRDYMKRRAAEILDRAGGRPGHIFNLGHGVLPSTPEDSVKALADYVHEYSARSVKNNGL